MLKTNYHNTGAYEVEMEVALDAQNEATRALTLEEGITAMKLIEAGLSAEMAEMAVRTNNFLLLLIEDSEEVAEEPEALAKEEKYTPAPCRRCGGAGVIESYSYHLGGVCFRCDGTGHEGMAAF